MYKIQYLDGSTREFDSLIGADLSGAYLFSADLSCADLSSADLPHFLIVPEEGDFIAYKALAGDVVIKVLVIGERTNSLVGRKCRTSCLKVLEIVHGKGTTLTGTHYPGLDYSVGNTLTEPNYNDDIRVECTEGLHFFMTKQEAIDWL